MWKEEEGHGFSAPRLPGEARALGSGRRSPQAVTSSPGLGSPPVKRRPQHPSTSSGLGWGAWTGKTSVNEGLKKGKLLLLLRENAFIHSFIQ